MKQALPFTLLFSPPDFTKDFILYLSAFENAIIGVFVQEDDARQEHVIYYVSQNIFGPLYVIHMKRRWPFPSYFLLKIYAITSF